jgi:putative tryptophan/tyrosine transport system substrate-binding protein
MKKKIISFALGAMLLALSFPVDAQQQKIPRIGWLMVNQSPRSEAFQQGLRELGYVQGKNLVIEARNVDGHLERLPGFAGELARLNVDVIVALEPPATLAAKEATKTIPIVMRSTDDPVEAGWVASLARPGGNITGVTSISSELYGKRLELLKEVFPRLSRVAVLWNPDFPAGPVNFKEMEIAAKPFALKLQSIEARRPKRGRQACRGDYHVEESPDRQ